MQDIYEATKIATATIFCLRLSEFLILNSALCKIGSNEKTAKKIGNHLLFSYFEIFFELKLNYS